MPYGTTVSTGPVPQGYNTKSRSIDKSIGSFLNDSAPAIQAGSRTLNDILGMGGATDPRLFNMQSSGISRDTNTLQQALQASLARSGMQGSGVGVMTGAALGQAGADRQMSLRSSEAQLQEQRKREDLQLLLQMLIGPGMGKIESDRAYDLQKQMMKQQKQAAVIGGTAALAGGIFGGPVGSSIGGAVGTKVAGG